MEQAEHSMFFVVTLEKNGLEKISNQLWTAHPDIYFMQVPEKYLNIGKMKQIAKNQFRKQFVTFMPSTVATREQFAFEIYTRAHSEDVKRQYSASIWDNLPAQYKQNFCIQSHYQHHELCTKM
uniref:Hexosyltransferase n=1 Tax=Panagrolaimus superbus TaxID=310955 RepID=A0A914YP20_9BILA